MTFITFSRQLLVSLHLKGHHYFSTQSVINKQIEHVFTEGDIINFLRLSQTKYFEPLNRLSYRSSFSCFSSLVILLFFLFFFEYYTLFSDRTRFRIFGLACNHTMDGIAFWKQECKVFLKIFWEKWWCQSPQLPIFSSEILSKIWVNSCISE